MKEKNIFDILENSENDSMDRLIENAPKYQMNSLTEYLPRAKRSSEKCGQKRMEQTERKI